MANTSYKESHLELGGIYDKVLSNKFEQSLWKNEKKLLVDIFKKLNLSKKKAKVLDFACGTGRITSFLENYYDNLTGVDISQSMLDKAKTKVNKAKLIKKDILTQSFKNKFDLIVSFRFFLNAEKSLRYEIMKKLHSNLSDDGYLVFNVHGNRRSLLGLVFYFQKKLGFKGILNTMSPKETEELIKKSGFRIVDKFGLGFLPGRNNLILLPKKKLVNFEYFLSKNKTFPYYSKDIIYVCKKNE